MVFSSIESCQFTTCVFIFRLLKIYFFNDPSALLSALLSQNFALWPHVPYWKHLPWNQLGWPLAISELVFLSLCSASYDNISHKFCKFIWSALKKTATACSCVKLTFWRPSSMILFNNALFISAILGNFHWLLQNNLWSCFECPTFWAI